MEKSGNELSAENQARVYNADTHEYDSVSPELLELGTRLLRLEQIVSDLYRTVEIIYRMEESRK